MKKVIFILAMLATVQSFAQVTAVTIQASGLTCSMCSNAIRKSLLSLDYVDQVKANIKKSVFEISFKPNANVQFDQMKKKVEDAGFFVADFRVTMPMDHVSAVNDKHVAVSGYTFHFLRVKDQVLSGSQTFRLLDKGYLTAKEFKKNAALTDKACYQTGMSGACCSSDQVPPGTRVYHITL